MQKKINNKKKIAMPKPRPSSLKADKTESLNKKFSLSVSKANKMKTGGQALAEAKKKINDPNYNVMSGRIEKDKNVQTGTNKRRITKEDAANIAMGAVPFLRIPKFIKKIGQSIKPSQRFQRIVQKTQQKKIKGQGSGQYLPNKVNPKASRVITTRNTGGGQGSGRFITQRSNRPTNTQITKPKNTQIKKPGTSITNRSTTSRIYGNAKKTPSPQQLANRAVKNTVLSELVRPKKSIAKENKVTKSTITKPKKAPVPQVKKEKLKKIGPAKDYTGQFINKKGEVAYESIGDFLGYLTGNQKKRAKPKDIKRINAATKGAAKGIAFSGKSTGNPFKFNKGGSLKPVPADNKGLGKLPTPVRNKMGYMRKGGVVKMRGGGAATRGMNFNRGY